MLEAGANLFLLSRGSWRAACRVIINPSNLASPSWIEFASASNVVGTDNDIIKLANPPEYWILYLKNLTLRRVSEQLFQVDLSLAHPLAYFSLPRWRTNPILHNVRDVCRVCVSYWVRNENTALYSIIIFEDNYNDKHAILFFEGSMLKKSNSELSITI
jgi:hypothetical protein